jgi:hypothetical protein
VINTFAVPSAARSASDSSALIAGLATTNVVSSRVLFVDTEYRTIKSYQCKCMPDPLLGRRAVRKAQLLRLLQGLLPLLAENGRVI